ncbi:hypothetical protein FDV58_12885 [Bradyrhizobium elkanii]|uniref:Uncharacterized protein n=1 Tax=Bradyrhizobium elkanii TaxID=29448 RepID=A0A4U6S1V9_BRAEL|nr:hypothetical protein [Bradyrhizobium elkanii]TKV81041.1 hypothetical protein FDV58_12885 [Bradyrhizobium elkanii]
MYRASVSTCATSRRVPKIAEQLRNDGLEVLANGPDGMRRRIADEVPKWRDIIAKAGIKPV